jgi:hypothetical protein
MKLQVQKLDRDGTCRVGTFSGGFFLRIVGLCFVFWLAGLLSFSATYSSSFCESETQLVGFVADADMCTCHVSLPKTAVLRPAVAEPPIDAAEVAQLELDFAGFKTALKSIRADLGDAQQRIAIVEKVRSPIIALPDSCHVCSVRGGRAVLCPGAQH